jgi:hypothetical protein
MQRIATDKIREDSLHSSNLCSIETHAVHLRNLFAA